MYAYSYGTPIRVWDIILAHTRMGRPIRVWDVPYAYGPIYAYGAEQRYLWRVISVKNTPHQLHRLIIECTGRSSIARGGGAC